MSTKSIGPWTSVVSGRVVVVVTGVSCLCPGVGVGAVVRSESSSSSSSMSRPCMVTAQITATSNAMRVRLHTG